MGPPFNFSGFSGMNYRGCNVSSELLIDLACAAPPANVYIPNTKGAS